MIKKFEWIKKYSPISLKNVIGHKSQIQKLINWAFSLEKQVKIKENFVVLLCGPYGIGKTIIAKLLSQ